MKVPVSWCATVALGVAGPVRAMAGRADPARGRPGAGRRVRRLPIRRTTFADTDAGFPASSTASSPARPSTATREGRFLDAAAGGAVRRHRTGWLGNQLSLDAALASCALTGSGLLCLDAPRHLPRRQLDSVNFRSSTLTDVTFENCLLRDTEFGGATLLRYGFGGRR